MLKINDAVRDVQAVLDKTPNGEFKRFWTDAIRALQA